MKFLILIALLFGSLTLAAQKTYFSDANLQKTKQKNAVYQITVTPQDSIFYVACENLNKQKLWQGTFKDKKLTIKHGLHMLFENNQKTVETTYKDNLKNGEERFFDNNGEIKEMQFYIKGTNITPVNFNTQKAILVVKKNKNKPTKDKLTKYEIANGMDFENVYGLANKYGKLIVPMQYDRIDLITLESNKSHFIANKRGISAIFDLAGQPLLKTDYDEISYNYYHDTYKARKDTLFGLLDMQYKVLLPVKYRSVYFSPDFKGDDLGKKVFVLMQRNNNYMICNTKEQELMEVKNIGKEQMFDFQWNSIMYDGAEKKYVAITIKEITGTEGLNNSDIVLRFGIFSLDNTINIPYVFQEISLKHQKLPNKAKKDNKYGYIDLKGNTIIPFKYDFATDFDAETQTAEVSLKNKWVKINKKGVVLPPKKESEPQFGEFKEVTPDDTKYELFNNSMSNTIKTPVSDYQVYQSNGVLQVKYKDILIGSLAVQSCYFDEKNGIFNVTMNDGKRFYLNPLLKPLFLFEYDSASFW